MSAELRADVERLENLVEISRLNTQRAKVERDEALRKLDAEAESHRETAEIMRRARERADGAQRKLDAIRGWCQEVESRTDFMSLDEFADAIRQHIDGPARSAPSETGTDQ